MFVLINPLLLGLDLPIVLFFHSSAALMGLGILSIEVSRSHSDTPQSVGLLWTKELPVAETPT
jgi:hypothetical protein